MEGSFALPAMPGLAVKSNQVEKLQQLQKRALHLLHINNQML